MSAKTELARSITNSPLSTLTAGQRRLASALEQNRERASSIATRAPEVKDPLQAASPAEGIAILQQNVQAGRYSALGEKAQALVAIGERLLDSINTEIAIRLQEAKAHEEAIAAAETYVGQLSGLARHLPAGTIENAQAYLENLRGLPGQNPRLQEALTLLEQQRQEQEAADSHTSVPPTRHTEKITPPSAAASPTPTTHEQPNQPEIPAEERERRVQTAILLTRIIEDMSDPTQTHNISWEEVTQVLLGINPQLREQTQGNADEAWPHVHSLLEQAAQQLATQTAEGIKLLPEQEACLAQIQQTTNSQNAVDAVTTFIGDEGLLLEWVIRANEEVMANTDPNLTAMSAADLAALTERIAAQLAPTPITNDANGDNGHTQVEKPVTEIAYAPVVTSTTAPARPHADTRTFIASDGYVLGSSEELALYESMLAEHAQAQQADGRQAEALAANSKGADTSMQTHSADRREQQIENHAAAIVEQLRQKAPTLLEDQTLTPQQVRTKFGIGLSQLNTYLKDHKKQIKLGRGSIPQLTAVDVVNLLVGKINDVNNTTRKEIIDTAEHSVMLLQAAHYIGRVITEISRVNVNNRDFRWSNQQLSIGQVKSLFDLLKNGMAMSNISTREIFEQDRQKQSFAMVDIIMYLYQQLSGKKGVSEKAEKEIKQMIREALTAAEEAQQRAIANTSSRPNTR